MNIKNIKAFIDAKKYFNSDEYVHLTENVMKSTIVYRENFIASNKEKNSPAVIYTEENTTLITAERLKRQHTKVAALNFANATTPGGGVLLGANAQEEYLCRSGNLYKCLTQYHIYRDFYLYHILKFNTYYSDRIVYSEDVAFFGNDGIFNIDIITSPAPNIKLKIKPDITKVTGIFESRIKNILEVAIDNKVNALVLGAFGCGAFGNNPNIVAEALRKALKSEHYENYFNEIVFAIKASKDNANYIAFKNVFNRQNI